MLKDYIEQTGVVCWVKRNNDPDLLIFAEKADVLVLSPGPQTPDKAGQLMEVLTQYSKKKPILGVCLGHQAIGLFFGAELKHASLPMHGKVDMMEHQGNQLFHEIPHKFKATRYHSLILEKLPAELDLIATSPSNEVMAIAHISLPIWGIQFHPESCTTPFGFQLIKNFLAFTRENL